MRLPIKLQNALTAIRQIRAGEWVPHYNSIGHEHYTAHRENLELWLANGPWFCEITNGEAPYFGLLWRHLVWWAAALKLKYDADHKNYKSTPILK